MSIATYAECDQCGKRAKVYPDQNGIANYPSQWITLRFPEFDTEDWEGTSTETAGVCSRACAAIRLRTAEGVNLFTDIGRWGARTFPQSNNHAKLSHLAKEFEELKADPESGEEMADMVMILCHLAASHGVDLWREIERKFEIVQTRQWGEPDADGVMEHIREEVPS